ncbi:MAG: hypothetical protein DRI90_12140 [Deltaproteobacteria bacterium]|nr:MAG: hypothetical protein DRI90_12140 [Deltaproteobacteria bacterium]
MFPSRWPVRRAIALTTLAICGVACQQGTAPRNVDAGPPPPEPILPSPAASTETASFPEWAGRLPKTAPTVKPGARVWATVPQRGTEMASVGIYTVEGIYDGQLSLTDKMGQGVSGVPPAVVHLAGKTGKLAEGAIVLCYAFTLPGALARIAELEGGKEIQVRYDWAGITKKTAIYHAEPPREGVVPLAFVGFPKAGTTSRGLLIALSDTHGWVQTSSGHIEIHEGSALEALPLPQSTLKAGAAVRAYAWATGYRAGVITKELEPGLRYRVKLEGNMAERDYFFSSLIPSR